MKNYKKEFVEVAIGVIEELNKLDKYCCETECKECPLNSNPDECNFVDKLKNNLIEGIELVVQKLKYR